MNKKNKILAIIFVVCCIVIIGVASLVKIAAKGNFGNDVICNGASINGIDIGGMTKEEANTAIDKYIAELSARKVTINMTEVGETVETAFSELGFSVVDNDYVDKAYQIGKRGNIFERFAELNAVDSSDITYTLQFTQDNSVIEKFVQDNCSIYDQKAINSKLKLVSGKFKATKDQSGMEVQIDDTVDAIVAAIDNNIADSEVFVDATVKVTEPKYTRKMVAKCKDLLGSFSTSYSTSTAARANNVQTAAGYINGTILYPGQTFSTIKVIKDRTEANGYQTAPEYSSGKVVDGVGGGVCQVSTTLYNAVINAELKVVERSPHSMIVQYVSASRDAAISGDYKDFKFKNNTDAPVYIAASADGGLLSFKIYGEETRASNRTIEFKSEIIETIQPGEDVVTEDTSKPASYRVVTQYAHVGYKAQLWKIIYIDGVQKKKVQLNSSSYSAEPQYVTVGKQKKASPSPSASPDNKATSKPKASPSKTKAPSTKKN